MIKLLPILFPILKWIVSSIRSLKTDPAKYFFTKTWEIGQYEFVIDFFIHRKDNQNT